jgi:hypothetical protein
MAKKIMCLQVDALHILDAFSLWILCSLPF